MNNILHGIPVNYMTVITANNVPSIAGDKAYNEVKDLLVLLNDDIGSDEQLELDFDNVVID